jgi:hypothetical protein
VIFVVGQNPDPDMSKCAEDAKRTALSAYVSVERFDVTLINNGCAGGWVQLPDDDTLIGTCGKPLKSGSSVGDGAVVVAVILVCMMQVALHQIVSVITVRDCLVTASRAVGMLRVVVTAGVGGRTRGRIRAALGERMLVHMAVPTVDTVQMAVVEIIDVVIVLDRRMAASGAVAMRMRIVGFVIAHDVTPDFDFHFEF